MGIEKPGYLVPARILVVAESGAALCPPKLPVITGLLDTIIALTDNQDMIRNLGISFDMYNR